MYNFFRKKKMYSLVDLFFICFHASAQLVFPARRFGQYLSYLFLDIEEFAEFQSTCVFPETSVALSAMMSVCFAEVVQEHLAPAGVFCRGIFYHGLYAGNVAFLAVFVYFASDVYAVLLLSLPGVDDERCLLPWNVVKDASLGKHD